MDPEKIARELFEGPILACSACLRDLRAQELRDFSGVPVCVDCYRDFGLLAIAELKANPDRALLAKLLSSELASVPVGPLRRFENVERFASRIAQAEAEKLVVTAARGMTDIGLQELLWILLAADAVARSGGLNGSGTLDERALALLYTICARIGMDVAWAAMLDSGVAARGLSQEGNEFVYEDVGQGESLTLAKVAFEQGAFARYIRAVRAKVDLLADDLEGRADAIDIPLSILRRTADEILTGISLMQSEAGPRRAGRGAGPAAPGRKPPAGA